MTDLFGQEPAQEPETAPEPAPGASAGTGTPERPAGRSQSRAELFPPLDLQRRHCGDHYCRCTHDNGCEFGWIDTGSSSVEPCPICRPGKIRQIDETRPQWLARLRGGARRAR